MFWLSRRVIVPPYCGVPRLSHQFPVTAVVDVVVVGGAVVVVVVIFVVVEVLVFVVVDVDVVAVLVLLQDAKTSDVTMRHVSAIQMTPLFISTPFFISYDFRKTNYEMVFYLSLEYSNYQWVRLTMPLTPITPRAPSREGQTTTLSFEFNH